LNRSRAAGSLCDGGGDDGGGDEVRGVFSGVLSPFPPRKAPSSLGTAPGASGAAPRAATLLAISSPKARRAATEPAALRGEMFVSAPPGWTKASASRAQRAMRLDGVVICSLSLQAPADATKDGKVPGLNTIQELDNASHYGPCGSPGPGAPVRCQARMIPPQIVNREDAAMLGLEEELRAGSRGTVHGTINRKSDGWGSTDGVHARGWDGTRLVQRIGAPGPRWRWIFENIFELTPGAQMLIMFLKS